MNRSTLLLGTLKCSIQYFFKIHCWNILLLDRSLISALHLKYCFFNPRSAALNLIFFEGSLAMEKVWRKVIPHQFMTLFINLRKRRCIGIVNFWIMKNREYSTIWHTIGEQY
jgi:hypothetical protein